MSDHDTGYERDENAGDLTGDSLPVYDDDIPATTAPGTKEKRRWFAGRKKAAVTTAVTATAAGTQNAHPPRGGGKFRLIHGGLTALLILATAGQFALFSGRLTQLEEDQMALARRVPSGITQRLDVLESALEGAAAQNATLAALKTQLETLTSQTQNPQALRQEFRDALAQVSEAVATLSRQQEAFRTRLSDEQQRLKTALDTLKSAQAKPVQTSVATPAPAKKTAAAKAAPAKAPPPVSGKKTASTTKKAGTQTAARPSGRSKPPFELRGIEYRGGVPYAVTTTPGDTRFSSLQLLMAGQSRSGWRLVRTTDNSAVFRAPAGTEITLAIR
ncbi:TPA: hypothetical protein OME38_004579 [Klebsiella oxytoca]|nr:hypothetical protein [Klebsiella oxytoca]